MRSYEIVLINTDVAHMYHGMEKKLFYVFKENYHATGLLKTITDLQIKYILQEFSHQNIDDYLREKFEHDEGYNYSLYNHSLHLNKRNSFAKLVLHPRKMVLSATGDLDAETIFFEVLRNYLDYFLAMNYQSMRYGWLKPIRANNMVQQ